MSLLKENIGIVKYIKKVLWNVFFITIVVNIIILISSFYSYYILNSIFHSKNFSSIFIPTIGFSAIYLMLHILNYTRNSTLDNLIKYIEYGICDKLILTGILSNTKMQSTIAGQKMLSDLKMIKGFLMSRTKVLSIFDVPCLLLFGIILFYISKENGILYTSVFAFCIMLIGLQFIINKLNKNNISNNSNFLYSQLERILNNYLAIKAMDIYKIIAEKLIIQDYEKHLESKSQKTEKIMQFIMRISIHVAQLAIFFNSIYLYLQDKMTIAGILVTSVISSKSLQMLCNFASNFHLFIATKKSFYRMMEGIQQIIAYTNTKLMPPKDNIAVSVLNASYLYHNSKHGIKNINIDLHYGKLYAVTGTNESGRTTLLKMISNSTNPTSGYISYHDTFYNNDFNKNFALCERDVSLFYGTIKEYIKMYIENVDLDITEITTELWIHDKIMSFQLGYDTIIDGNKMSLSFRKKLQLASCLVLKPKILVLDDPFIFFDNNYIELLIQILSSFATKGTLIVIATNNKQYIQISDYILHMRNMQLVHIIDNKNTNITR